MVESLSAAGATLADLRILRTAPADLQERMLDNLGVRNPVWRMRLVFAASTLPEDAGVEVHDHHAWAAPAPAAAAAQVEPAAWGQLEASASGPSPVVPWVQTTD